jgi:OsmC-like protein
MTTTDTTAKGNDSIRNGVDTTTLFATLDAVKQAPEAASFQFRAHNQWVSGTHNRTTIADYYGVGEERTQVRSTVTGDIDLNGILGLDPAVRNGYQQITVRFTIKGDAPAEQLRELLDQSRARSAVYDVITNQVPVTIEVDTV